MNNVGNSGFGIARSWGTRKQWRQRLLGAVTATSAAKIAWRTLLSACGASASGLQFPLMKHPAQSISHRDTIRNAFDPASKGSGTLRKTWLALLLCAAPLAAEEGYDAGDSCPEFELLNTDGRAVRLSEFRGRVVVLHLFATW